jgi:hypothetical protein
MYRVAFDRVALNRGALNRGALHRVAVVAVVALRAVRAVRAIRAVPGLKTAVVRELRDFGQARLFPKSNIVRKLRKRCKRTLSPHSNIVGQLGQFGRQVGLESQRRSSGGCPVVYPDAVIVRIDGDFARLSGVNVILGRSSALPQDFF